MVKEKKIQIENFQKITENSKIKNINDLQILYLELATDDKILGQFDKIDKNKNNLKQLYLYFKTSDERVLLKMREIISSKLRIQKLGIEFE